VFHPISSATGSLWRHNHLYLRINGLIVAIIALFCGVVKVDGGFLYAKEKGIGLPDPLWLFFYLPDTVTPPNAT
jgi:hypothetical protein